MRENKREKREETKMGTWEREQISRRVSGSKRKRKGIHHVVISCMVTLSTDIFVLQATSCHSQGRRESTPLLLFSPLPVIRLARSDTRHSSTASSDGTDAPLHPGHDLIIFQFYLFIQWQKELSPKLEPTRART